MPLGEGQLLLLMGGVAVLRRRRAARRRRFSYVLASMFERKDYGSIPRLDLWGNFLQPCRLLGYDDKFREKMRCTPATFDALVERLKQTDTYRRWMQRTGRGRRPQRSVAEEVMVGLYVLSGQESYSRVATTCNISGKGDVSKIVSGSVDRGTHGLVADVAPRRSNASSLLCASSRTKRFVFPRTPTAPRSTRASKPDGVVQLKPHVASRSALAR